MNWNVPDVVPPLPSFTVTVTVNGDPDAVVGEPLSRPAGLSVMPGGNPVAAKVTGSPSGSLALPARLRLNATPTVPDCGPGAVKTGARLAGAPLAEQ